MAQLSIGQAARLVGRSKSTISRAIKTGRLSANRDGDRYLIDPAELTRVFDATGAQPEPPNDPQPPAERPATPPVEAYETEIRMLREMLDRERETVEDLRTRLNRAESLLTDQRPKPRRWWPW